MWSQAWLVDSWGSSAVPCGICIQISITLSCNSELEIGITKIRSFTLLLVLPLICYPVTEMTRPKIENWPLWPQESRGTRTEVLLILKASSTIFAYLRRYLGYSMRKGSSKNVTITDKYRGLRNLTLPSSSNACSAWLEIPIVKKYSHLGSLKLDQLC